MNLPRGIWLYVDLFSQCIDMQMLIQGGIHQSECDITIKAFSPFPTPRREMHRSLYLHSLTTKFSQCIYRYGSKKLNYRGMSMTAAMDSPTLPLAGIRVLDMTRVLAGVSKPRFSYENVHTDIYTPAIRYTNSRRPGVGNIESCRH